MPPRPQSFSDLSRDGISSVAMGWPPSGRRRWLGGAPLPFPPGCIPVPGSRVPLRDLPSPAAPRPSPCTVAAAFLPSVPVAQVLRFAASSRACSWRQGGHGATAPTFIRSRTALPSSPSPVLRSWEVPRAAADSEPVSPEETEFSVEYQVEAKIVKKEAELKAVRDRLKATASARTDTEAELEKLGWSPAEVASLERAWTLLRGREDRLRKEKQLILDGLRDLLKVEDDVESAVDARLKLQSVNSKINDKQNELQAIQADLEAVWQEQDHAKRLMRRRDPTADHAHLDRVEMAVNGVEECLHEDKEYIRFVLQVLDTKANALLRNIKNLMQVRLFSWSFVLVFCVWVLS